MKKYTEMTKDELLKEQEMLKKEYDEFKALGLTLDMSRGKPAPEQLDISMGLLNALSPDSKMISDNGLDTRNYNSLEGIPEARKLMADVMGTDVENVIVCGNSSLNIMYDTVSRGYSLGYMGNTPWCKLDKVKWLCPVPGYDRHFAITEHFGIEMINIPINEDGPDMDMIEKLVSEDDSIKGIWCVPKYTNPEGVVYSEATVKRFAALKPAAKDFRIFWDNAYVVHHLYDEEIQIPDIISECEKAGNPDMVFEFASTSKVTFAGAGIAAFASSKANVADHKKSMTIQTIGYDKVNMLRHVNYFKDFDGLRAQMKKHAELLRPKFEIVMSTIDEKLGGLDVGSYKKPMGGYFITYKTLNGCATRTIALAKEAGMVMTGAGAPFPYKKDPDDAVIRISPSYPSVDDMAKAAQLFTICVRLATVEKLLGT